MPDIKEEEKASENQQSIFSSRNNDVETQKQ
jgi:hypothetical protein